jgi:signal transduction histidine kinase
MGRLDPLHGLRADGSEFPIEASISHSSIDGRHLMTVILRDVSDRKRIEDQLLHAQKMEVIGRLAGGIAHDFNNLLMAIFNYLALATRGLDANHPSRAPLTQVHEVSNRAARLTRQLLTFARKQPTKPVVLSPGEVLTTIEPMLRQLITDTITLSTTIDPDTPTIRADPSQVEQVLMNLVVNARDAMPEGGTIAITTGCFTADLDYCIDHPSAKPGRYATLEVTGMTEEILARIFEPFFTTKEPGKGTGLGLATCHGIVTQSGGHLTVKSAPGHGTTIRVLLPSIPPGSPAAADSL